MPQYQTAVNRVLRDYMKRPTTNDAGPQRRARRKEAVKSHSDPDFDRADRSDAYRVDPDGGECGDGV